MTNNFEPSVQNSKNSSQPLISVIVPVYKVEPYLVQCVESIVNQTYQNIEIILVDDGSPDQCGRMCDEWAKKDSRIFVIHKENGGTADARNKGMKKASGLYISYVDGDDIVEHEYIEYLYQAIQETGADFSECIYDKFSKVLNIDNSCRKITPIKLLTKEEILSKFANGVQPVNHYVWNKLYRRELITDIFFPNGYQSEDILYSCQVFCKAETAAHIDNILYHYRSRPRSESDLFTQQRQDAFEMAYQSLELLEKNHPYFVKDFKSYYYSLILGAVDWAIYECSTKDSSEMIKKANTYRRKIHLTKKEWKDSSLRQKIRCISSLPGLNVVSLRMRHFLNLADLLSK